jgi:hypothetical protein
LLSRNGCLHERKLYLHVDVSFRELRSRDIQLPAYVIFGLLFNQPNALQNICDVIYSSFLNFQHFCGSIKVYGSLVRSLDEGDEFLREQTKRTARSVEGEWVRVLPRQNIEQGRRTCRICRVLFQMRASRQSKYNFLGSARRARVTFRSWNHDSQDYKKIRRYSTKVFRRSRNKAKCY